MENTSLSKYTISFGLSLALASVMNALLVVAKEKIPTVQAGLQRMTGHHWVSHVAIILALFAAFGWMLAGLGTRIPANRLISLVVAGVVAGGVIITGFYLAGG